MVTPEQYFRDPQTAKIRRTRVLGAIEHAFLAKRRVGKIVLAP